MFKVSSSCDDDMKEDMNFYSCLFTKYINYTYFLIISFVVIIGIFIVCAYLCLRGDGSDGRDDSGIPEIRTAASDLNEGTCDMIPAMHFNLGPFI